jgi:hypothetical protein
MLEEFEKFKRWIEASHILYETFEKRHAVYPISLRWVKEWYASGSFTITEDDVKTIADLVNSHIDEQIKGDLKEKICCEWKEFMETSLRVQKGDEIGSAISPYLFLWNFGRFKKYFDEREDFKLKTYFDRLGDFLRGKSELKHFETKRLISDQIEEDNIRGIFEELNGELREIGVGKNEPVGTVKLLHLFAPHYFPLIDNEIAKKTGLLPCERERSLSCYEYLKWMKALKDWLQSYDKEEIEELEKSHNLSTLKLIDEGLYVASHILEFVGHYVRKVKRF